MQNFFYSVLDEGKFYFVSLLLYGANLCSKALDRAEALVEAFDGLEESS